MSFKILTPIVIFVLLIALLLTPSITIQTPTTDENYSIITTPSHDEYLIDIVHVPPPTNNINSDVLGTPIANHKCFENITSDSFKFGDDLQYLITFIPSRITGNYFNDIRDKSGYISVAPAPFNEAFKCKIICKFYCSYTDTSPPNFIFIERGKCECGGAFKSHGDSFIIGKYCGWYTHMAASYFNIFQNDIICNELYLPLHVIGAFDFDVGAYDCKYNAVSNKYIDAPIAIEGFYAFIHNIFFYYCNAYVPTSIHQYNEDSINVHIMDTIDRCKCDCIACIECIQDERINFKLELNNKNKLNLINIQTTHIIMYYLLVMGLLNRSAVSNPTPTDAQTDPTNEPTADPITNSIPAPTDIPSIQSTHALFGVGGGRNYNIEGHVVGLRYEKRTLEHGVGLGHRGGKRC